MAQQDPQRGIGTFAIIGAFVGLGAVFLLLFFVSGASKTAGNSSKANTAGKATSGQQSSTATSTNKEAPYIRIPQNSLIYNNTKYDFMFAYPDSFNKLTETPGTGTDVANVQFSAESALADKKPVGPSNAILNGPLRAYVYTKADFKILVADPQIFAAPTKTGNDTTWKIVSRGDGAIGYNIGDAYPVKTVRSQTGITVFDFGLVSGNKLISRWVLESGDNYILIALPYISKPDGSPLTDGDRAAYNIIGNNIARTVRIPSQ